jgi:hypothetical protein
LLTDDIPRVTFGQGFDQLDDLQGKGFGLLAYFVVMHISSLP